MIMIIVKNTAILGAIEGQTPEINGRTDAVRAVVVNVKGAKACTMRK